MGNNVLYKPIDVWEVPVRLTHWMNVLTILVLSATGFYIGHPIAVGSVYLMGWVRFIHAMTAFVFTLSVLARIYWAFVGNRYANWKELIPVSPERRVGMLQTLAYYNFLRDDPSPADGHNPLAGISYFILYLFFVAQILTGFALRSAAYSPGFYRTAFGWILVMFGSQTVRLAHHLLMWVILAWVVHHIYSAILIDAHEKNGLITSIFTGYKFRRRQV